MKKVLIAIVSILLVLVLLVAVVAGSGIMYIKAQRNVNIPDTAEVEKNPLGTITAVGKGLYDQDGKRFEIKGINFGNLFVSEGWMTVNSLGAKLNEDGTFEKVNGDGIVEEYEEVFQEEMDKTLAERFTDEQLEALNNAYFNAYCTEADFKLIADMGLNTIRVPVFYRNFLNTHDRYRLTDEELCAMNFEDIELDFSKGDTFISYAKKYDLKIILDMHGAMGGQSGYEHCGTPDIDFWYNEEYIKFMCNIWQEIAKHYATERSDLASTIVAYDLVNEPVNKNEASTGRTQWDVMDRLYDAIREVDAYHVISIEGVWYPNSLPNPDEYGWKNVLYQYHFYNWSYNNNPRVSNEYFYTLQFALYAISNYDVPKLVGEFNLFGAKDEWIKILNIYDDLGWNWTIWSYKTISVGYWDTSWGLVVNRLNLRNNPGTAQEDYNLKLDLRTASYDEIMSVWGDEYTHYDGQSGPYQLYRGGVLYNVLKGYFGDKCVIDTTQVNKD